MFLKWMPGVLKVTLSDKVDQPWGVDIKKPMYINVRYIISLDVTDGYVHITHFKRTRVGGRRIRVAVNESYEEVRRQLMDCKFMAQLYNFLRISEEISHKEIKIRTITKTAVAYTSQRQEGAERL